MPCIKKQRIKKKVKKEEETRGSVGEKRERKGEKDFLQSRLNFLDCFQAVSDWVGTDVFRFYGVFWYHSNSVTNHEGTKWCLILCGFEIWVIFN